MKKSILVGIGVIAIGIGGMFFGSKIVEATSTNIVDPNMIIETKNGNVISSVENGEFIVDIKISTGIATGLDKEDRYSESLVLNITEIPGLEIVSAIAKSSYPGETKENDLNIMLKGNSIDFGKILYKSKKDNAATVVGPIINMKLKYKVLKKAAYNLQNKFEVKYSTIEYPTKDIVTKSKSNDVVLNIEVLTLDYKIDYITGEAQDLRTVGLNRFFDLNYTINPGTLIELDDDGNPLPNIPTENFENRDLMYVIDKGVIDLVGGNEEIARDSIKKSLEELKKTSPDTKASLVVYGEEAEIIAIDKETKFSIDALIAAIDKIEATDKSGNLGDGIRKAKYLINENSGNKSSVVIVSAGDPNYYTQISEGNTSMLETRVNKKGVNKEDDEKAEEYVNNIVNDIIINEEGETRWYGINYGVEKEELVLNNLIDKFEGFIPEIKKPYYDDFVNINSKATAAISVKATLSAKVLDETSGIIVHDDDKSKEIEIIFNKTDTGFVVANLEEIKSQTIRVKIDKITNETDYINVADINKLEIKLSTNFNENPQKVIFNKRKDGDLEHELNPITWNVKVDIPYIIRTGLFNGRYKLTKSLEKDIIDDIQTIAEIGKDTIDEVSAPELAIENHYAFGAIIKSNADSKAKVYYKKGTGSAETPTGKIYELVGDTFKNPTPIAGEAIALTNGKIYLVVVDDYIEANKIINGSGQSFDIGVAISANETIPPTDIISSEATTSERIKWDEWGITVHPVPKPGHF